MYTYNVVHKVCGDIELVRIYNLPIPSDRGDMTYVVQSFTLPSQNRLTFTVGGEILSIQPVYDDDNVGVEDPESLDLVITVVSDPSRVIVVPSVANVNVLDDEGTYAKYSIHLRNLYPILPRTLAKIFENFGQILKKNFSYCTCQLRLLFFVPFTSQPIGSY